MFFLVFFGFLVLLMFIFGFFHLFSSVLGVLDECLEGVVVLFVVVVNQDVEFLELVQQQTQHCQPLLLIQTVSFSIKFFQVVSHLALVET